MAGKHGHVTNTVRNPQFRDATSEELAYGAGLRRGFNFRRNSEIAALFILPFLMALQGYAMIVLLHNPMGWLFVSALLLYYFVWRILPFIRPAGKLTGSVFTIQGIYSFSMEGPTERTQEMVYRVGGVEVMPVRHWMVLLEPGQNMTVEVLETEEMPLVMVGLNGRNSIREEVRAGLKARSVVVPASLALASSGIFALAFLFPLMQTHLSPVDYFQAALYKLEPVISYSDVSELDGSLSVLKPNTIVRIGLTTVLPGPDDNYYYLADTTPGEWENLLLQTNQLKVPDYSVRKDLLYELKRGKIEMAEPAAWKSYQIFASNPLYTAMKKRYLQEGRRIMNQAHRELRLNAEKGDESMAPLIRGIFEYQKLARKFSLEFVESEERLIENGIRSNDQLLYDSVLSSINRHFADRQNILLRREGAGVYFSIYDVVHSGYAATVSNLEGRLEIVKGQTCINAHYTSVPLKMMIWPLIFLAIMLVSSVWTLTVLFWNGSLTRAARNKF